jgi:hypothetical protein
MVLVFNTQALPEVKLSREEVIEIMREIYRMTEDEMFISILMGVANHVHGLNIFPEEFLRILEEEIKK